LLVLGDGTAARACQRIEASLIIGELVKRFGEERPDLRLQTINDFVLVFSEAVEFGRD
jgi:hypothetical protein